ncbi:thioesterase II family protein [Streptomyces sp. NPDC059922]|uniref:thioesterase II family protein n=1 Tax=Streptomyces sp. NPDC059922 TaxID=3347005 RepID=UPI003668A36B
MADEQPVRLHCFAHAGAGISSFHGWPRDLGADVRAEPHLLPGRESRRNEPRVTGKDALLADLLDRFVPGAPDFSAPYVLYGHSLGAVVAYTLTRALHEAGLPLPALLAVGAGPPPDAPSDLSDACRADDTELLRLLGDAGAVPEYARPGGFWHRAVLPVLRDDLILAQALRAAAREPLADGRPLPVPLLAVAGAGDPLAPPGTMAGWSRWSRHPVVTRTVPGDHFFVHGRALPRLLGRACRVVRRTATTVTPAP